MFASGQSAMGSDAVNASRQERYELCVDSLYGSLTDPGLLPRAATQLAGLFGATGASLIRTAKSGDILSFAAHGYDAAEMQRFVDYYARIDPAYPSLAQSSAGRWVEDDIAHDPVRTPQPEYVNDFARHVGIRWFRGAKIAVTGSAESFFSVHRPADTGTFQSDAKALFERLCPHLARLARLQEGLGHVMLAWTAGRHLVEALSAGVCVVNRDGRVLHANPAAIAILASPGALQLHRDRLIGGAPSAHNKLVHALKLGTAVLGQGSSFSPNPEQPPATRVQVRVVPLRSEGKVASPSGRALVILTRGYPVANEAELRQTFGLTTCEADLCKLLLEGESPAGCAERRRVALSTVRSQIRSVLGKTGVSSLQQLTALLLAMPVFARDQH
jgi:PAS domain-containing protein